MAEVDAIEPIRIDAELWSHRDLLERVVARYFHIVDEISSVEIGWEVKVVREQGDPESSLFALNEHLRNLSWIAVLQEGNPYDLVILPEPPVIEGLSNRQMTAVWAVFTFFVTLAGAAWLQLQDSNLKLTDTQLLADAFSWFALPIVLVMFTASEMRRRLALRGGVDLGHHIPLAVPFLMTPSVPIWPFGVIGFTSQRRMDLLAFKDRKYLALTTIVTPLVLILSGMTLTIIGYWMTSNSSPQFADVPVVVKPSLLPEYILGTLMTSEEVGLRSVWLHPLGLAGIGLNTMGWLLLLPLPGFPGDRLLSALLSPGEMDEGGTQTWLFVGILAAGMYVLLYGGYWPWLILLGLGIWRRFSPEASATPFVLNESSGFEEKKKNRVAILMVGLLLLGFPGLLPVGGLQDWDAGLDTSEWPNEVLFTPGSNESLLLPLKTIGVLEQDVDFEFKFIGNDDSAIAIIWSDVCQVHSRIDLTTCHFQHVDAFGGQSLEMSYQVPPSTSTPFGVQVLWQEKLETKTHQINFSSSVYPAPIDMFWTWDGDVNTPQYCTNVTLHPELGANLTIVSQQYQAFTFDGGDDRISLPVGEGPTAICITGLYGTHQFAHRGLETSLLVTLDDGQVLNWTIPFNEKDYRQQAGGVWPADMDLWDNLIPDADTDYVIWNGDESLEIICPLSRVNISIPTNENNTWVLNLSEIHEANLPEDRENGTLIFPTYGQIVLCSHGQASWSATLVPANGSLAFEHPDNGMASPWKNYGNTSLDIRIETVDFGVDSDWNLSDFTLQPEHSTPDLGDIANVNPDILHVIWYEPTAEDWVLHLVSHCVNPSGCSGGDS